MRKLTAPCLLLAAVAGLAACTAPRSVTWSKPGVSDAKRQAVEAECRSYARSRVERDVRLAETTQSRSPIGGDELGTSMRRHEARQDLQRVFENCMRQQGYRPVTKEDTADDGS